MFMDLFNLPLKFWHDFWKADMVAQLGLLLALSPFIGGLWSKYRLKNIELQDLNKLCDTRTKQRDELDKKNTELTNEISELKSWLLNVRLEEAKKEHKTGNEERAINLLHTGVEAIQSDMASCCLELALHQLSLSPDYGEQHLFEAERLARIATLLQPLERNGQSILGSVDN